MLALLSLAAKSECLVDCPRAGIMDNGNELVGAFELESADCGDWAGEAPFVCASKWFDVVDEWLVDSFWPA